VDNLQQMVVFARVVEEGSFSGAARALGYSRAAVSKQIAGLERQVGAQLLNRTTRKMSLTEIGSEFYARCARIAHEVEEAERVVSAMRGKPAGLLRIACPMDFGRTHLASVVPQFLAKYAEVRVQLAMSDQQADLVNDRCDLAIRVTTSFDEASFVARRLATVHQIVCGSPEYLQAHGTPQVVRDLAHHSCLIYTIARTPDVWRFGGDLSVRVSGPLSANNGAALCTAALAGIGLVQLPTFLVHEELASGRLVRILREFEPDPLGVFALYPRNRMLAPKVAAFIDFLASQDLDGQS
jgi:DNA-binding transcriptional LysR family regulator